MVQKKKQDSLKYAKNNHKIVLLWQLQWVDVFRLFGAGSIIDNNRTEKNQSEHGWHEPTILCHPG